jgi:hypothetical protein
VEPLEIGLASDRKRLELPGQLPSTAEMVSNSTSTCPPSTAAIASGEVRNGTCSISTPVICLNSSPVKCCVAPKPGLANAICPGRALAAATNSLTSFVGKSGRVTMIRPARATSEIGSKAVKVLAPGLIGRRINLAALITTSV